MPPLSARKGFLVGVWGKGLEVTLLQTTNKYKSLMSNEAWMKSTFDNVDEVGIIVNLFTIPRKQSFRDIFIANRRDLFMIKNSFIFLDKIGQQTEQRLWKQQISSWDIFLETTDIAGIGNARKLFYNQKIYAAKQALRENDATFFAQHFPQGEHWRLYNCFKDEACYIDIETSGYYGDITVVGIFDGWETRTLVKGKNLDPTVLGKLLQHYKMIVSFNGSGFDLPVLNRYYPNTVPKIPHLDLRHALAKLGFSGGLKKIEKELGIKRAKEVADVSGSDAVYLWQMYRSTGKEEYLERLVQYNEEDVINLKPLAEFAYKEMKKKYSQWNDTLS